MAGPGPSERPTDPAPPSPGGECRFCDRDHARGSPDCPAAAVGHTIAGKYRLRRLLGVGGMGAVYEAEHLTLRRTVAIKRLHGRFGADPEAIARFHREAQRLAALAHPGIVRVADLGHDETGGAYIEMELLHGRTVADLLAAGSVPIALAVEITHGALEALHAAHAAGVVHRDLKPENLFLVEDAGSLQVKILDFGIAKQTSGATATSVTATGATFGTPLYMSPEQLRDTKSVDARSDLWAMGATLFELLTGRPPSYGETAFEVISRIALGNVDRHPRLLRREVPEWLDALVARALEQDPTQRFASAGAMAAALRSGPGSALPPQLAATQLAPAPSAPSGPNVNMPAPAAATPSRRPAILPGPAPTQAWAGPAPGATTTSPVSLPEGTRSRTPSSRVGIGLAAGCAGALLLGGLGLGVWGLSRAETGAPTAHTTTNGPDAAAARPAGEGRCAAAMVRVPGGVTTPSFCLDRTEVTSADYRRCVAAGSCPAPPTTPSAEVASGDVARYGSFCTGTRADRRDHPINCVDVSMAASYCRWAGKRLPTETEWEVAAGVPAGRRYPWGSWVPASNVVNACGPECALRRQRARRGYLPRPGGDIYAATMPVGVLLAGAAQSGALDLAGNVAEWVSGTPTSRGVVRGGSWMDDPVDGVQSSARRELSADAHLPDVGFRCASEAPR